MTSRNKSVRGGWSRIQVAVRAEGTWRFWGASYNIGCSERKHYHDGSSRGSIHIGGLGFVADDPSGNLRSGHFEQVASSEWELWRQVSQVQLANGGDALRIAAAGLEVLARKRAKGEDSGVDTLDTMFACLQETLSSTTLDSPQGVRPDDDAAPGARRLVEVGKSDS
jgi:hypothetical protein